MLRGVKCGGKVFYKIKAPELSSWIEILIYVYPMVILTGFPRYLVISITGHNYLQLCAKAKNLIPWSIGMSPCWYDNIHSIFSINNIPIFHNFNGFNVSACSLPLFTGKDTIHCLGSSWYYLPYYIQRDLSRITYEPSWQSTTWLYPHIHNHLRQW